MILNTKQIKSKILSTKKTRLNIYEGKITEENKESNKFDQLLGSSPENLIELLDDFNELYPNEHFTAFLITSGQSTEKGALIFEFRTDKVKAEAVEVVAEPQAQQPALNGKSEEDIRAEVIKEFEAKKSSEILIEEVKQLRIEIKEKDSLSGKFNSALEHIVLKIMQPAIAPPVNGALNGPPEYTEVESDVNDLEKAFTILLNEFGEENIIKLGAKLHGQDNEMLKSMLINFINS